MHKRIQELSKGIFECAEPVLQIPEDKIEIEVLEDQDYQGEIVLSSLNHIPVRGTVYSSNSRMACLDTQFEGEEVRIRYEFHSYGLTEGDILKGDFFIICNQGEYNLSFVVTILNRYQISSIGPVSCVKGLAELTKTSWEEGRRIFFSQDFRQHIRRCEPEQLQTFDALSRGYVRDQILEEFLCAAGSKAEIQLDTVQKLVRIENLTENQEVRISVRRSTWGYLSAEIQCDGDFITVNRSRIVSEDFMGSVCELPVLIQASRLHAGKNYGRISLKHAGESLKIDFLVSRTEIRDTYEAGTGHLQKQLAASLLGHYEAYRLQKTSTAKWVQDSMPLLEELIHLSPEEVWLLLIKANLLILNEQRQEGEWSLDEAKRRISDKKSPQWGYYQLLRALWERDSSVTGRIWEEVNQVYLENQENILLFYGILVFSTSENLSSNKKIHTIDALEKKAVVSSVLLSIERCYLYLKEPYLIHTLDKKTVRLLRRIAANGLLSEAIVNRILELYPENMIYHSGLLRLLEECMKVKKGPEVITAACAILIKSQKYSVGFFKWYEKGIAEKARITGLYEAYLLSMDKTQPIQMPRIILMYFKYHSSMDSKRRAMLYAEIIKQKAAERVLYEDYRKQMEQFTVEQLLQHKIDENLALLYEEILPLLTITPELAEAVSQILFMHKISCLKPGLVRVIVYQEPMKQPQVYPVVNGCAYFPLFSLKYKIVAEDAAGNRYLHGLDYQLERLMRIAGHYRRAMEASPLHLPYIIYYFEHHPVCEHFSDLISDYFRLLISSSDIQIEYKTRLCIQLFSQMPAIPRLSYLQDYLQEIQMMSLLETEVRFLVLLMQAQNDVESATILVNEYGVEKLSQPQLEWICEGRVRKEPQKKDLELLFLAEELFMHQTKNELILTYLQQYYSGPTRKMVCLWELLKKQMIPAYRVEEEILCQMLYSTEFVDQAGDIFQSYQHSNGDSGLIQAYLNYFSYQYFSVDMVAPDHFFEDLKDRISSADDLHLSGKLALLKFYAELQDTESQADTVLIENLLKEMIQKNLYFAFYKKFDLSLQIKYQIYEKTFLEYHTNSESTVRLFFSEDPRQGYREEEMTEMFSGIYIREWVLFFGETISYYITEESSQGSEVTLSGQLVKTDVVGQMDQNRYAQLNELVTLQILEDHEALADKLTNFMALDEFCQSQFPMAE